MDIVAKLKGQVNHPSMTTPNMLNEAVAEIERLRAAIEAIITNTTREDSSDKLLLIGCRSIALKALSE